MIDIVYFALLMNFHLTTPPVKIKIINIKKYLISLSTF